MTFDRSELLGSKSGWVPLTPCSWLTNAQSLPKLAQLAEEAPTSSRCGTHAGRQGDLQVSEHDGFKSLGTELRVHVGDICRLISG